ncbi:MAG: YlxR family protein [Myxococcota bacterium]|nr:YlxR family protein [Myxococcota bacterium]
MPRDELMRLAIAPDAPYLAPDPQRKLGGRGVSVHPTRACVELAAKKGGFARALKRGVAIDAGALCEAAAAHYERRAESLLIAAARRRRLAIGTDAVRAALRSPAPGAQVAGSPESSPVEALIVAADAEGRREELQANAARLGRRCTVLGSKSSLGRLFGRDEVGVLGVLDRAIADEVVRCAAHAAELKSPEGSSPDGSSPGNSASPAISAAAGQGERGHGGASARVSEAE